MKVSRRALSSLAAAVTLTLAGSAAFSSAASADAVDYCGSYVAASSWCIHNTSHYYWYNSAAYPGSGIVVCQKTITTATGADWEKNCDWNHTAAYIEPNWSKAPNTLPLKPLVFNGDTSNRHTVNGHAAFN